jgi:hypothetical protein
MGGYGSGNWHKDTKVEVQNCRVLSCSWLLQNSYFDLDSSDGLKLGGITWFNILGDPIYNLSFVIGRESESEMVMTLSDTGQRVSLNSTPMRYGGVRWWFECPKCLNRCAKLYKPAREDFLCRCCHNLTYRGCNNNKQKIMGYSLSQIAASMKATNWFKYPPWRRKRDRRPDYRDRGAWLREAVGDRWLL